MPDKPDSEDINEIRGGIDSIDNQILELLNKRAKLALKIKKTSVGKSRIRPERESAIVRRLSEKNAGPLPKQAIREIFTQIISSFRDTMQLERPICISFLGPSGTYSEEAAVKLLGVSTDLHPENTISGVVRSVEAGSTDLAVVPIENSSEGAVRETHKLLFNTSVKICGEISLPIVHNLLSRAGSLDKINFVYAHPQALAQCSIWLKTHLPKAELISVESNARAAEFASVKKNSAAIAGEAAGKIYNMKMVERGINDQPDNTTRFVALGNLKTEPTGNDKTSLICVLVDKAGALYEILGFFAEAGISMTRLESQPYKTGQYAFYIDFIGHQQDKTVAQVLKNISDNTKICTVLGSYPREINS